MSYEQQTAVELAKQSISKADKNSTITNHHELVEHCSKALEIVNHCPDIYYFYKRIIQSYRSLAKLRDILELYYYSQAIKYCEKYLDETTDELIKEGYKIVLKRLREQHNNSEQRIKKEKESEADEKDYKMLGPEPTLAMCDGYLELHPNGYWADVVRQKRDNLVRNKLCAYDNDVFDKACKQGTIGALTLYLKKFPDGCNTAEANQRIQELAFQEAATAEAYDNYAKTYPDSQYAEEARTRSCRLKANSYWEQIKNSTNEYSFQNYINTFPCINNRIDAENKIADIRYDSELERGKQYALSKNFTQAKEAYQKAQNIKYTQEVRDSLRSTQIELEYDTIRQEWDNKIYSISKYERFLSDYKNEKYSNEVIKMLCSRCLAEGISQFKLGNETSAKDYFNKVLNLNCAQANTAKKYLAKITRNSRNCYSAIFETGNLPGYGNNYLLGISVFRLQNRGVGGYLSYRASNDFYLPKKELNNYPADEYNLNAIQNPSMSSVAVSFGLTKKIFHPLFCYFGLGAGMNTLTQKYSVTNLTNHSLTEINGIDKTDRSLFVAPELGLMVDLWGFTLTTGIKYSISANHVAGYHYKGLTYQAGIGFGITDIKSNRILNKNFQKKLKEDYEQLDPKPCAFEIYQNDKSGEFEKYKELNKYRRKFTKEGSDIFGSVGMDFGYPNQNLSFSKDEMIYNKSYTVMLAFLNTIKGKWGGYISFTANPYLFKREYNWEVTDKNLTQKTAKAMLHVGPTVKIAYPVWLYFGAGVQYTKVFEELDSDGWVSNKESEKWAISPQTGVMLNLWGFFVSVGINHPIYFEQNVNNNGFNPRLSITIGGGG
jgi:hypothetical protein